MMRFWICMVGICLAATPAHAVMVRNLSGTEQLVVVERGGTTEEVLLEAGGIFRRAGNDISLYVPGQRPIQTEFYEEYAIWPDGALVLQKLNKSKGQMD